jgi:hypothetical protein
VTKRAVAVGVGKRHHDEVAFLHFVDLGTDVLDNADRFVAHAAAFFSGFQIFVRPQIAAADAGASDAHKRIGFSRLASGTFLIRTAPARYMIVAREN